MKAIYARFVLFLIRPALELHLNRTQLQREEEIDQTVFKKMAVGRSAIKDGLDSIYGLTFPGRQ